MQTTVLQDVKTRLRESAREVDAALSARLGQIGDVPASLLETMRYSVEAGGKRLRPALVLWCCELVGGTRSVAMAAAMAVECVHTFSLIHDDLPAIDNDDLRRGKATCHKQFGEAMAILAGDGLLTLAFEILSHDVGDAVMSLAMIRELSAATGASGLIGGEVMDIEGETQSPDKQLVASIHAGKTARLIEAACRLGALAARADERQISALGAYGRELGFAFQAADDLLDVTGDTSVMGKPTRRDQLSAKQTYVRAVGVEEAGRMAKEFAQRAVTALAPFGESAARLVELAWFTVERES